MGLFSFDEKYPFFDTTPVDNLFIQQFLLDAAGRGEYVRVYLYGLMHTYHRREEMTLAAFAKDLKMAETEVENAFRYWERRGLVQIISGNPPAYRYISAKQALMNGQPVVDTRFEDFALKLNALFGADRRLHGGETAMAMDWVEKLGIPEEAVLLLVAHLIETRGKKFTFKAADKLAVELAEEQVQSAQDAEMLLNRRKDAYQGAKKVIRRMGKRREPSQDEEEMYAEWLRLGFTEEAILAACRETVKGDPTFAYLNGILRGLMKRTGTAPGTQRLMEKTLDSQKRRSDPLRELYSVLGLRGAPVTEGTITLYEQMAADTPHEVILLAGGECARTGGKLDDVMALLDSWKKKGLLTAEQVREHIVQFNRLNRQLQELYTIWGKRTRPTPADRAALTRWTDEYGFSEACISLTARHAEHTERPVAYMETILKGLRDKGVLTLEGVRAELAAFKKNTVKSQPAAAKRVSHQDYDQRVYSEDDFKELKEQLEEEKRS